MGPGSNKKVTFCCIPYLRHGHIILESDHFILPHLSLLGTVSLGKECILLGIARIVPPPPLLNLGNLYKKNSDVEIQDVES